MGSEVKQNGLMRPFRSPPTESLNDTYTVWGLTKTSSAPNSRETGELIGGLPQNTGQLLDVTYWTPLTSSTIKPLLGNVLVTKDTIFIKCCKLFLHTSQFSQNISI